MGGADAGMRARWVVMCNFFYCLFLLFFVSILLIGVDAGMRAGWVVMCGYSFFFLFIVRGGCRHEGWVGGDV